MSCLLIKYSLLAALLLMSLNCC